MFHQSIFRCGFGLFVAGLALANVSVSAQTNSLPLCVMSFNLRFASPMPPHAWPERRPIMRDCIRNVAPDLIGTQEGLYGQLKELATDLPEFSWIGTGRDGGSRGEFMAVFYRRDRFEPMAYDHFWLSDTPEVVGSTSWGNSNRRMVTWVRLRERTTAREFYFWNTHLDHEIEQARQKGAALIAERVKALKTDLPVFLVGDFNANAAQSRAYDILTKEGVFADTWFLAKERLNERLNSFHGYRTPVEESQRIDWILARGPVTVAKTEVVSFQQNGQNPSDHYPVAAWLTLPAAR